MRAGSLVLSTVYDVEFSAAIGRHYESPIFYALRWVEIVTLVCSLRLATWMSCAYWKQQMFNHRRFVAPDKMDRSL
jgi:hypothetical protein